MDTTNDVNRLDDLSFRWWFGTSIGLGFIHHVDHVLRYDHSGWPFREGVNAFTFSLLVYPVALALLMLRRLPRVQVALAFLLFIAPTLSHILIETPWTQYETWATQPETNLLGVRSPALGVLAGTITVALSVATLLLFLATLGRAKSRKGAS